MLKATATGSDGRSILVLGLTFANLDEFRAAPGDSFIRINGKDLGLPLDVMIFAGRTEAHCAEVVSGGIGPDTKLHISDRLKD